MYVVLKPFKTAVRKFKKDDPIAAADLGDHAVMTFDEYVERGFIKSLTEAVAPVMRKKELDKE